MTATDLVFEWVDNGLRVGTAFWVLLVLGAFGVWRS